MAGACGQMAWIRAAEVAPAQHAPKLKVAGCPADASGVVRCTPTSMRASVDAQLHELGLFRPHDTLSLDAYSIARNIQSEASTGSLAEKAAIAQSALNRARRDGISISQLTMRDGTRYARQMGRNPRVASSQDPTWQDVVLAIMALRGELQGTAKGATHYFSPKVQDSLYRQGRVSSDRWDIYNRWTKSWGYAWVGPIGGIDPHKQFLMREVDKDSPEFWAMHEAGKRSLAGPGGRAGCPIPKAGVAIGVLGVGALVASSIYLYRRLRT